VEKLKKALGEGELKKLLAASAYKRRFNNKFIDKLDLQSKVSLPPQVQLAKTAAEVDPGASLHEQSRSTMPELAQVIAQAGREMESQGINLWGISPTQNHFFLHGYGGGVRYRAKKTGIFREYNTKLGLVYGAFFGFRVLHDAQRYTRYGQIKDDVERSLRYWHIDGSILRYGRYCVTKTHKPGKFFDRKGGISAGSSAEKHEMESRKALKGIVEDFAWPYVSLPSEDETKGMADGPVKNDWARKKMLYGLVWKASEEDDDEDKNSPTKGETDNVEKHKLDIDGSAKRARLSTSVEAPGELDVTASLSD
jgi:hypothetical protein